MDIKIKELIVGQWPLSVGHDQHLPVALMRTSISALMDDLNGPPSAILSD